MGNGRVPKCILEMSVADIHDKEQIQISLSFHKSKITVEQYYLLGYNAV
jgi:hypothetical protein